jgi:hypothetical protein
LVAFGIIFSGVQYLFLAEVHGVDLMLLGFCLSAAIGDTFYWPSYHAYFAVLGDSEHRGHQISAREALASVAGIIGPLLGGWTLTVLGPRVAFRVARNVPGAFRAAISGIMLFAADGWIAVGYYFVWQIALFVSLGESFTAFGGALALAGLVGAIGGLILGKHIDAGHGGRAVWWAFASLAAVTVLRAASSGMVALMTAVYNQAKCSPCTLRFHVATEGGWDIGGASGCLAAALLSEAGAPLPVEILISLAGTAVSLILLRRYYKTLAPPDLPLTQPVPGV